MVFPFLFRSVDRCPSHSVTNCDEIYNMCSVSSSSIIARAFDVLGLRDDDLSVFRLFLVLRLQSHESKVSLAPIIIALVVLVNATITKLLETRILMLQCGRRYFRPQHCALQHFF